MAFLLSAGSALSFSSGAMAATTFVVNRIGDASDRNLSDTRCDVSSTSGNQCTLRAAIQEANDTGGIVTINFNITSASKTITPATPLPTVAGSTTINGYSQSGAKVNTKAVGSDAVLKIILDGINAGAGANGIVLDGTGAVVRGLVIQRFDGAGVFVTGYKDDVHGNFIGTAANGTTARGNGTGVRLADFQADVGTGAPADRNVISGNEGDGVLIDPTGGYNLVYGNYIGLGKGGGGAVSNGGNGVHVDTGTSNRIGGPGTGQGNVISGNDDHGIFVFKDSGNSDNVILGNRIGTNAAGTLAIPNGGAGIKTQALAVRIGDVTAGSRNVISGNTGAGIELLNSDTNIIQGNLIGTKADGTGDLGNDDGIRLLGTADDNTIGGSTAAAANVIANSDFDGILITGGIHNSIERNVIRNNGFFGILVGDSVQTIGGNVIFGNGNDGIEVSITSTAVRMTANQIYGNGKLAIDLRGGTENGATVTANDNDDPDTGGNALQNFPVLTSAVLVNSSTVVSGSLNSIPSTEFRIEIFLANPDASGHGEPLAFFGAQNITTNSSGDKSFSIQIAALTAGQQLTATATAVNAGNTSELSANVVVVTP
jgi:CSLREA domain-containing protein